VVVSGCEQEWVEQPAGVEVNPGEEAVLACRLQGKKGDCRLGCSYFHNLIFALKVRGRVPLTDGIHQQNDAK
jgi:hypothetical protein